MLLEGKKVFVGPFLKRTDRPADKEAHYTNIYVKNVAESVTEEQLEKMFAEHGKVCLLLLVPGRSLLLCGLTSVSSLAIISAMLHSGFSLHAAARTGCAVNLLLLSAQVTSCMIMKDDEGKSRALALSTLMTRTLRTRPWRPSMARTLTARSCMLDVPRRSLSVRLS